jgi:hypothetical protein
MLPQLYGLCALLILIPVATVIWQGIREEEER